MRNLVLKCSSQNTQGSESIPSKMPLQNTGLCINFITLFISMKPSEDSAKTQQGQCPGNPPTPRVQSLPVASRNTLLRFHHTEMGALRGRNHSNMHDQTPLSHYNEAHIRVTLLLTTKTTVRWGHGA